MHQHRQLALQIINNIPKNTIKILTDGSKIAECAGSGIYIETPWDKMTLCQCNPDYCSVFRSELISIDWESESILTKNSFGDLSYSCNLLQHLSNWMIFVSYKTSLCSI